MSAPSIKLRGAASRDTSLRLVRSGLVVGLATLVASLTNYATNVVLGRALDPAGFSDAAVVVSGVLLVGAVALGFQLNTARAVAIGAGGDSVRRLRRVAMSVGLALGALTVALAGPLSHALNMGSAMPIAVVACGFPWYLPMAVDRGVAQATGRFGRLAASLASESTVRLGATFVALGLGAGATAASIGVVLSFAAAMTPTRRISVASGSPAAGATPPKVIVATVVLLVGHVAIMNGDLWIVKAMVADDSGTYAAVALIGRLVFVAAWTVTTVLFPSVVAGRERAGDDRLLWRAVELCALVGLAMTVGAAVLGRAALSSVLGPDYVAGAALLWPYALATTGFVVANVVAVAEAAAGRLGVPAAVVVGAVLQSLVLVAVSEVGIEAMVWSQVIVMSTLAVGAIVAARWRTSLAARARNEISDTSCLDRTVPA